MRTRTAAASVVLTVAAVALVGCSATPEPAAPSGTPVASPSVEASAPPEGSLFNPTDDAQSAADLAADLVVDGATEKEAITDIEKAGFTYRVVARDGEAFPVTADYSPERINIEVRDGYVVSSFTG